MPVIKATNYEGRPAFNQAWAVITREMHIEMLAKPNPRKLKPWPDPQVVQPLPIQISPATLNCIASKRLRILSRVPRGRYTSKYKIQPPSEHFVESYNLTFVPTPRILELSQPRTYLLQIKERRSTKKQKRKWKMFEKDRQEWLALRASPKPPPPSPSPWIWKRRTTALSPEEHEIRMFQLSRPPLRYLIPPDTWNPYQVNPKSQRAIASKRILKLAAHRVLPAEAQLDLAFKPFKIKRSALRCKASKRIIDLAAPVLRRTAGNNDLKEDAFIVPARALKAMCSKRTKELAKPIVRRGF